ncbi:MAG: putative nucleotidyltransferase [Cyclobacteriaceae bacterium]|jgi:predicted nucleotidyltransferase
MNDNAKHIARLIRENISDIDPNAEVILYGSRARGEEKKDSDWDVLVLTSYPVNIQKERIFRDHLYDLELETGEPFSIFVYSESDWHMKQRVTPFYTNVTNEGITL